MNYMVHVSNTMWGIKNQPSIFTSCGDNALHLLVLVVGRLYQGFQALVENMVKKNRNRFPIAVLLTTLICSQYTTAYLFFIYQLEF